MIWQSTLLMTLVDLTIVAIAGAALWLIFRSRARLVDPRLRLVFHSGFESRRLWIGSAFCNSNIAVLIPKLKRRSGIAEPPFAWIKHLDGFRRFTVVGVDRAKAHWSRACTARNLRKLARLWREGRLSFA